MCLKENLRLRSSSDPKTDKTSQDQKPAIDWSEGTQNAIV